jgi:hypothetical protein
MATRSHEPSRESAMGGKPDDSRERAEHHAQEAERLLKSWWLSSHVKGLLHATLALYYSARHSDSDR